MMHIFVEQTKPRPPVLVDHPFFLSELIEAQDERNQMAVCEVRLAAEGADFFPDSRRREAVRCQCCCCEPLIGSRWSLSHVTVLSPAVRDPAELRSPGTSQPGLTCARRSIWQIGADGEPRRAPAQHIVSRHLKHLGLFVCICSALGEQTLEHCPRGAEC